MTLFLLEHPCGILVICIPFLVFARFLIATARATVGWCPCMKWLAGYSALITSHRGLTVLWLRTPILELHVTMVYALINVHHRVI